LHEKKVTETPQSGILKQAYKSSQRPHSGRFQTELGSRHMLSQTTKMKKEILLAKIKKIGIIRRGQFKLRSGMASDLYCDARKLFGDPNLLLAISCAICKMLPKDTTCVAGSGYGGLPLAAAVALVGKTKLSAVRNETKSHGIKTSIECYIPGMKDRVVIVDDLFTTGSSILDTAKELKKEGAKIIGAIVVIKRSKIRNFSIPLQHLFTFEEIIN